MADGVDVRDLVPDDPQIRLIAVSGRPEIGAKRNFACSHATGDVIAHWDDDDFSAPRRIVDQVSRLAESGKSVTGYRTMRFTDGSRSWMYRGMPNFVVGTSLMYRKLWWEQNRFPSVQVGEDNAFGARAAGARQLSLADAGDFMYATVHSGNTSPRIIGGPSWSEL